MTWHDMTWQLQFTNLRSIWLISRVPIHVLRPRKAVCRRVYSSMTATSRTSSIKKKVHIYFTWNCRSIRFVYRCQSYPELNCKLRKRSIPDRNRRCGSRLIQRTAKEMYQDYNARAEPLYARAEPLYARAEPLDARAELLYLLFSGVLVAVLVLVCFYKLPNNSAEKLAWSQVIVHKSIPIHQLIQE